MSKALEVIKKYWKVFASVGVLIVASLLLRRPKTAQSTSAGAQAASDNTRETAIKNQVQDSAKVNDAVNTLNTRKPETEQVSAESGMDELVEKYNKL